MRCSIATPDVEETVNNPILEAELTPLLDRGRKLLNVNSDQYDGSIRHEVVKSTLVTALGQPRGVKSLPLAVERRKENPAYVTWSGTDTVLGEAVHNPRFRLWPEARVTKVYPSVPGEVGAVLVRDLAKNADVLVLAKVCPQLLPRNLWRLTRFSFCVWVDRGPCLRSCRYPTSPCEQSDSTQGPRPLSL